MILAAGTFAQSSFAALAVGLPALAPALRTHYGLTLGEIGVVLGSVGFGMLLTLLPWGLLADRSRPASVAKTEPPEVPQARVTVTASDPETVGAVKTSEREAPQETDAVEAVEQPTLAPAPATIPAVSLTASTDATMAKAQSLGGSLVFGPMDIPQGRFAVLADANGAAFGVIRLTG